MDSLFQTGFHILSALLREEISAGAGDKAAFAVNGDDTAVFFETVIRFFDGKSADFQFPSRECGTDGMGIVRLQFAGKDGGF